jgi:2-methylcitrate dehydratase PrpD
MTTIETLAGYVATSKVSGLGERDRDALKRHVVDSVGALVAGLHTAEGRALARLAPAGSAPFDAVAVRSAAARLTEIDDIHLTSCTTPGAVIVTTALTLATAQRGAKAQAFAEAVAVGYEAMTRLGRALDGPKVLYRGVWPTCFTAPFGAAAVAARLAGLDADGAAHALAMALAQATPGPGRPPPPLPSRWLVMGQGARAGCFAAHAAAAGFSGDLELLDGKWLSGTHGLTANANAITDSLGTATVLSRLSLKPFCTAKQAVGAVAALQAILKRGIDAGSVRAVRVYVPEAYRGMISTSASPANRTSSIVSAAYQLALAARDPDGLYDISRESVDTSGPVAAFAALVKIDADPALAQHYPARWPARVEVETTNGAASEEVLDAPGDPGNPLDLAAVKAKFHKVADRMIGERETDAWIAAAERATEDDGALAELGQRLEALELKFAAAA